MPAGSGTLGSSGSVIAPSGARWRHSSRRSSCARIDAVSPVVVVSVQMGTRAASAPKPRVKREKRAYHHGDLARALVTSALDLVAKRGPESLTLREVAAGVGVTHGA